MRLARLIGRELYASGGKRIESFLEALAKVCSPSCVGRNSRFKLDGNFLCSFAAGIEMGQVGWKQESVESWREGGRQTRHTLPC